MSSSPSEPDRPGRPIPPPAGSVSQREARMNLLLASVLSGAGCLVLLLVVLGVMLLL